MPRANLRFAATHVDAIAGVIPGGDPVAPPELAADTPVLDVAHPLVIGLCPVLRNETGAPALDRLEGRRGERGNLHVPLVGEVRLEHRARAVAARHLEAMFFDAFDEAGRLELRDDTLARLEPVEALEARGHVLVQRRARSEDVDLRQPVAQTDLV